MLGGAMRAQASGTVPYIASLDPDRGASAYLAVHLAGTQGALSAGAYATAGWLLATAVIAARRRVRWLLVAAIAPTILFVVLVTDLAGVQLPDAVFPIMVACLIAGPSLGMLLVAVAIMIPSSRGSLAAPARARET